MESFSTEKSKAGAFIMWILIIEISLTVSEIPLTVSGISPTHNPKETRVPYAVQYEDFF